MERVTSGREPTGRRRFLRGAGALATTLVLAGCTQDVGEDLPSNERWPIADVVPDLPVRQRREDLVAGIEALSAEPIEDVDGFVAALEPHEITFESVAEVAERLRLEYVASDPERHGIFRVIGPVAGAYAALAEAGIETNALELVVFESEGVTLGVVEIATEWAVAYTDGERSAGEYAEFVVGTIESRREPPEPDVAPEA